MPRPRDPYHHSAVVHLPVARVLTETMDVSVMDTQGDASQRMFHPNPDRCDQCRVPRTTTKLLTFALVLEGKRAGSWTLCQPCWAWRNPPPDPRLTDPLTVL